MVVHCVGSWHEPKCLIHLSHNYKTFFYNQESWSGCRQIQVNNEEIRLENKATVVSHREKILVSTGDLPVTLHIFNEEKCCSYCHQQRSYTTWDRLVALHVVYPVLGQLWFGHVVEVPAKLSVWLPILVFGKYTCYTCIRLSMGQDCGSGERPLVVVACFMPNWPVNL